MAFVRVKRHKNAKKYKGDAAWQTARLILIRARRGLSQGTKLKISHDPASRLKRKRAKVMRNVPQAIPKALAKARRQKKSKAARRLGL